MCHWGLELQPSQWAIAEKWTQMGLSCYTKQTSGCTLGKRKTCEKKREEKGFFGPTCVRCLSWPTCSTFYGSDLPSSDTWLPVPASPNSQTAAPAISGTCMFMFMTIPP